MAIEKKAPPSWWRSEAVEVTCVAAVETEYGLSPCVWMFWRAAASLKPNEQDMFVLTVEEDMIRVNGVPIDASDEDQELICRMTDATILGPHGPAIGTPVTTSVAEIQSDYPNPKEQ